MSRRPAAPPKPPAHWTSARQTRPGREGAPTVYSGSRLLAAEKELQTLKCMLQQLEIKRRSPSIGVIYEAPKWFKMVTGADEPHQWGSGKEGGDAGRDEESNDLEAIRRLDNTLDDAEDKGLQAAILRLNETWKDIVDETTWKDIVSEKHEFLSQLGYMQAKDYQDSLKLVKEHFRSIRIPKKRTYDRFNMLRLHMLNNELEKKRRGGGGGSGGIQGGSPSGDEDMGSGEVDEEGGYLGHRGEQGDNQSTNQGKQGVGGPGGTHRDPSAGDESQEGPGDAEGEDSGGVAEGTQGTQGDSQYYAEMLEDEEARMPPGGNGINPEQQEKEIRAQGQERKRAFEERKRKREEETRARGEGDTEEDKKDRLYQFVLESFRDKWGHYVEKRNSPELQADRDTLFRWRTWCRLIRSGAFFGDNPYVPAGSIASGNGWLTDSLNSLRRNVDGVSLDDNKRVAAANALIQAADIIGRSSPMRAGEITHRVVDKLHNARVEDTKEQLREQYGSGTVKYYSQLGMQMVILKKERNERVEMYRKYFEDGAVDPPATDGKRTAPGEAAKVEKNARSAQTRRDMGILDDELRKQQLQEYILKCRWNGDEPDQLVIIWLSTSQS